jgi:hypothetical protein
MSCECCVCILSSPLFLLLEWRYLLRVSSGSLFVSDFVCRFRGQDTT